MKNILFATTALVATAGIASAEVAVTGFAEVGILGGDGIETQFHTDIDVFFTMTGEADNGLTFGAKIDIDETDGSGLAQDPSFNQRTQGGETYFVAFGNARLDAGDTDGAFDAALTEIGIGGALGDDHTAHAGFDTGTALMGGGNSGLDGDEDGQIARFSYTFDSFTGHLSVEMDDAGVNDPIWGLGVAYNAELAGLTLGVGLGYQTQEDRDIWGLSLATTFNNGLQAIVNYSSAQDDATNREENYWGIGLGYSMNALTVSVNYGEYGGDADQSGFGLAANYDLGGGLVAQLGYGSSDVAGVDSDSFSLGLAMSF